MSKHIVSVVVLAALAWSLAAPLGAQTRPIPIVEAMAGWAGFVDENWIDRTLLGAAGRIFVTERIAVGPEFAFLRGSHDEYDWTLTGNATIDLIRDTGGAAPRIVPYLAFGGGYLRQVTRFGTARFSSGEGTVSGGAGARFSLGRRLFLAPELRVGYEPELRFGASLGFRPGR
ncbi:MAG: hypothetical protein AB7N65_06095 [Vicinamibacterales bacterium]